MDIIQIIKTRRTIHKFLDKPVDPMILREALEAAIFAPNHKLTRPMRCVVAGVKTKEKIFARAKAEAAKKDGADQLSELKVSLLAEKFFYPTLVAFIRKRAEQPQTEWEDLAALSCGVQNFCLYLHSQGLGTKWSTGKLSKLPGSYEDLGVDHGSEVIEGFLWVGYAREVPTAPAIPAFASWVSFTE